MKNLFSILAIALMLVACGGNSSQTSEATEETAVEAVELDSTTIETSSEGSVEEVEVSEESVELTSEGVE